MSAFQQQYDAGLASHAAYLNISGVAAAGSGAITGFAVATAQGQVRYTLKMPYRDS